MKQSLLLLGIALPLAFLAGCKEGSFDASPSPGSTGETPPPPPPKDLSSKVVLHRPSEIGDRCRLSAETEKLHRLAMAANGKIVQSGGHQFEAAIETELTVLKISSRGQPTKIQYEVVSLTREDLGGDEVMLLQGTTMIGSLSPDGATPTFTIEGTPVSDQITETLVALRVLPPAASVTDDDVYGTPEAHAVGDSWIADPEKLATLLAHGSGTRIVPAESSGTIRLAKLETLDDVRCQSISGDLRLRIAELPDVPPKAKVEGEMTRQFTVLLPVEPDGRIRRYTSQTRMKPRVSTQSAGVGSMVITIDSRQDLEMTFSPIDHESPPLSPGPATP